nr:RDD family protein [Acidobacteriota bacterium]
PPPGQYPPPPGPPPYGGPPPAAGAQDFKTARLAAMGIDIGIGVGVGIVVFVIIRIISSAMIESILSFSRGTLIVLCILQMVQFLVIGAYYLARDILAGANSWGKKIMKIRVVDAATGGPISLMQSIRRNLGFGAFAIVTGVLQIVLLIFVILDPSLFVGALYTLLYTLPVSLLGLASLAYAIWEFINVLNAPEGQRWGDKFAGTRVVR